MAAIVPLRGEVLVRLADEEPRVVGSFDLDVQMTITANPVERGTGGISFTQEVTYALPLDDEAAPVALGLAAQRAIDSLRGQILLPSEAQAIAEFAQSRVR